MLVDATPCEKIVLDNQASNTALHFGMRLSCDDSPILNGSMPIVGKIRVIKLEESKIHFSLFIRRNDCAFF